MFCARSGWLSAILVGLIAGCSITVDPPDDGGNGGDGGGGPPDPQQVITVNLINETGTTLDAEFYVAAGPVSVDELFSAGNKFTMFGVGTIGLLADFDSDSFALDCATARVLGTRGGRFGDNLNQPDGMGQQIVLSQDLNIFCGDTLTIRYRFSNGQYQTVFEVTRP